METQRQRKMAELRKMERVIIKIDRTREEVERLRSQREERVRQRNVELEILQDQKQDVEEKIQRAQDVLTKTNHGMRHEYKEAMIQSATGVGTTNYILNVESQLCRALHGMYVLNRLYSARQAYMLEVKTAWDKVVKVKQEEAGVVEFQTVKLLCQKEFEMQEFSDWIEEQCRIQCEMLSLLKDRVDHSLYQTNTHYQHHGPIQTTIESYLPAIDEKTDKHDDEEDEDDQQDDDDDENDDAVVDDHHVDDAIVEEYPASDSDDDDDDVKDIKSDHHRSSVTGANSSVPNSSLVSFFMVHSKLDFEQQQRWLEAGNDSESYCTLFVGDVPEINYETGTKKPSMGDKNSGEMIPAACQPVAQSA